MPVIGFGPVSDTKLRSTGSRMVPCSLACLPPRYSREGRNIMPTYRAYLIDGDNRVASYKPIDADSDADALRTAQRFVDGCDVEVWDRDRKIGRLSREKSRRDS
jgi:hypothetical protein